MGQHPDKRQQRHKEDLKEMLGIHRKQFFKQFFIEQFIIGKLLVIKQQFIIKQRRPLCFTVLGTKFSRRMGSACIRHDHEERRQL